MTAGRGPEDVGETRPRWQARWFPGAVIASVTATMAALAPPCAANLVVREVAGSWPHRSARAGALADVAAVTREGTALGAGALEPHGIRLEGSAVPGVRTASAAAPPAPRSRETKDAKTAPRSKPPETTVSTQAGDVYWVQIGAFREAETAKRIAQRLREQKYQVHESAVTTRPAAALARGTTGVGAATGTEHDRYEVVVTGGSASEVEARLTAKGLTSRAATEGAVITPALPLGEAVALSQDLSRDGLPVRVQRVEATTAAAPGSQSRAGDVTLHRVRVGGFADRAAAEAALRELGSRGYDPVLTRGSE